MDLGDEKKPLQGRQSPRGSKVGARVGFNTPGDPLPPAAHRNGTKATFKCWIPRTHRVFHSVFSLPNLLYRSMDCRGSPPRHSSPVQGLIPPVPHFSIPGAAPTLCSVQLSQLPREMSGSKAAADGDKECFQCSKTIIPLCLIKFSAAIRHSKTMCLSEKSLSLHTSPLKCPPYFRSQMRKYWEYGFVILIISLPHGNKKPWYSAWFVLLSHLDWSCSS